MSVHSPASETTRLVTRTGRRKTGSALCPSCTQSSATLALAELAADASARRVYKQTVEYVNEFTNADANVAENMRA